MLQPQREGTQNAVRRLNTVSVLMDFTRNAGSASPIVANIPADMTPTNSYTTDVIATDGTPSRLLIRSNGEVEVDVTGKRFRIWITYPVN